MGRKVGLHSFSLKKEYAIQEGPSDFHSSLFQIMLSAFTRSIAPPSNTASSLTLCEPACYLLFLWKLGLPERERERIKKQVCCRSCLRLWCWRKDWSRRDQWCCALHRWNVPWAADRIVKLLHHLGVCALFIGMKCLPDCCTRCVLRTEDIWEMGKVKNLSRHFRYES